MTRWIWCIVLGLAGCQALEVNQTPAPSQSYGPWGVQGCTIATRAADVALTTQGYLNHAGQLEVKATFTPPLARPPYATLSGLPTPVFIEGANRTYTLFVPYTPETVAHFLQSGSYLTLSYQPLGHVAIQDVSFPTAPLMQALGALGGCE